MLFTTYRTRRWSTRYEQVTRLVRERVQTNLDTNISGQVPLYINGSANIFTKCRSACKEHKTREVPLTPRSACTNTCYPLSVLTRCQSTMTMLLTILACLKVPLIYLVVSTNSMVTRCRSTFPLAL